MKLIELLEKRFSTPKRYALRKSQAEAFGLKYPLDRGWVTKFGQMLITEEMIALAKKNQLAYRKEQKDRKEVSSVSKPDFLLSYEWRKLRMEVLKKYGPRCMCCGASPSTGSVMNVDHIKPRAKYPELALAFDNLQILCNDCNHGKGNWDETDWRPLSDRSSL